MPDASLFPYQSLAAAAGPGAARGGRRRRRLRRSRRAMPGCARRSPGHIGVSRGGAGRPPTTSWSRTATQQALDLIAPGAAGARRQRGRRGPRLPPAAAAVRVARGARWPASRSTTRGWSSTPCPRGTPAGLRHAVAPVPARHVDVAAAAPGAAGLGRARRRRDRRGRLRQRVPLRRPPASSRCRPWTRPAACSTSARSRRRCCRRCGSASWSRRRRCAPAVRAAKLVTDWHTPLPAQAALASFIDAGPVRPPHPQDARGVPGTPRAGR